MAVYNSSHTGAEHDGYVTKTELINLVYPVGSIYVSVNSTSPATLFGGTWSQIQNTFLLAAGSSYTAGSTGGAATVALTTSQLPAHAHTLNSHTHTVPAHTGTAASGGAHTHPVKRDISNLGVGGNGGSTGTSIAITDNQNIYYPSIYADTDGAHTHTVNISAFASGTPSNNSTGSTGSGGAHNNMPPYLTVYMWKRTA